jgi:CheY-like chemotaxis protein
VNSDLRLLVVDDDPLQLELVHRSLGYEGFEIETTSSLDAAMVALDASDGSHLKSLAVKVGAHGWLSKSWALPEIARRLRELQVAAPG